MFSSIPVLVALYHVLWKVHVKSDRIIRRMREHILENFVREGLPSDTIPMVFGKPNSLKLKGLTDARVFSV